MAIPSAFPDVYVSERDFSYYPSLIQNLVGAIVVDAPRGSEEPQFVGSIKDLWQRYTVTGKYERGFSTELLEAEKALRGMGLWVVRVVGSGAKYGGAKFYQKGANGSNAALSDGVTSYGGYTFGEGEAIVIFADSKGDWDKRVSLEFFNYASSKDIVKTPGANLLRVYVDGELREEWVVGLRYDSKNADGKKIWAEDVLQQSLYVRCRVNPAIASMDFSENVHYVKEQKVNRLALGGGVYVAPTVGRRVSGLELLEPESFKISAVADYGIADVVYQQALVEFAQNKRAIAFLSVPYDDVVNANYVSAIRTYKEGLNITGDTATFGALYANWLKVYQRDIDSYLFISPTGFVMKVLADTWGNWEPWYAPAGWKRGGVIAIDVARRMSKGDMGVLYDYGINCIRYSPLKGIAVWGQKTLYPLKSARDRINVRLLLNYIENSAVEFLESFVFDLNNADTWYLVKSGLEQLMSNVQSRGGVYEYFIPNPGDVTDAIEIDNGIMNVVIALKPVKAAEYINLVIAIASTGADLKVVANLAG